MKNVLRNYLLAIILGVTITAQAALLICPKCSYEQPENATQCNHCGAMLPKRPSPSAAPVTPTINTSWTTAADDDWRKASEAANQNKVWLAWFYARNAFALNIMTEGTNSARAIKLTSLMELFEKHLRATTATCPLCRGSGHGEVRIKMSDGREQVLNSNSKACTRCNGTGTLRAVVGADVLNHVRAQAKRDYDALQKDRGWMQREGLWLPAKLNENVAPKDQAQLLHALGSPCIDCAGMGILACAKCDGAGWNKCSNLECISGTTPCADCKGTGKPIASSSSHKSLGAFCTTCNGTGRTTCRTCKGLASISCQTSNGKATLVCKTCNGSGQNPICAVCKGDGLMPCTHCHSAGKVKDMTCTGCNGVGQVVCPNCKGAGRMSKR